MRYLQVAHFFFCHDPGDSEQAKQFTIFLLKNAI